MILSTKKCDRTIKNIFILWRQCIPKMNVLISYIIAFMLGFVSMKFYEKSNIVIHIIVGVMAAGVTGFYAWKSYR